MSSRYALHRLGVVILTHNRREEVLRTLRRLAVIAPDVPLAVVDNASSDGTPDAVQQHFPQARLVRAAGNLGAAGRNLGVEALGTAYVAFCDDDVCWLPSSLEQAQSLLDRHPDVAVLSARVLVGAAARPDPACMSMAVSPLDGEPDVGPALIGFMAGACVVRTAAFRDAGGYWPPLFIGGEEALLALDLMERGWRILYAPALLAQHWPSTSRNASLRRRLLARNALLTAWMRLPWPMAVAHAREALARLPDWPARATVLQEALRLGCRAGARRQVVGEAVGHLWADVHAPPPRPRSIARLAGDGQDNPRDVA